MPLNAHWQTGGRLSGQCNVLTVNEHTLEQCCKMRPKDSLSQRYLGISPAQKRAEPLKELFCSSKWQTSG